MKSGYIKAQRKTLYSFEWFYAEDMITNLGALLTKIKILPGPIFSGAKYVGVGVGFLCNDAVELSTRIC